jgi:hypothetical protein
MRLHYDGRKTYQQFLDEAPRATLDSVNGAGAPNKLILGENLIPKLAACCSGL